MAAGTSRKNLPAPSSKQAGLADQTTDLKTLRDSVVDAAAISAGLWISYLFVLFYLLIAVGGVTHRNLFFEDPVKLPFLNVDLPLVGFFVLGPAIFLIVHAYVLLHFALLADKVGNFHAEMLKQISDDATRARLLQQLPTNIFVQILAGPREVRGSCIGKILRLIALISLVIGPLALLVFFQLQFLPYHPSWMISLWQRGTIVLDLALLWTLWPSVSRGKVTWVGWRDLRRAIIVPAALLRFLSALKPPVTPKRTPRLAWRVFWRVLPRATVATAGVVSLIPVLLIFTVATSPGEWWYEQRNSLPIVGSLHKLLLSGTPNEVTGRPGSWFSDRLVLTDQSFVDPDKFDKMDVSHSFRGRDLRYAVLSRADLRKADFTGAKLNNASLASANLQSARFGCASTGNQQQESDCAILQGADLQLAKLQDAILTMAQMQKANLKGAMAQRAVMKFAQLEGATLDTAQLQGSILTDANLRGASLHAAQLQGARLGGARLQGANLLQAQLQGADAGGVQMQGATLVAVQMQGASLGGAHLEAADLTWSNLDGADLTLAELQGATLVQASLKGANLELAQLQGANLSKAEMQGASIKKASTRHAWVDTTEGAAALPDISLIDIDDSAPKRTPWFEDGAAQTFREWRDLILESIPQGPNRDAAQERLSALDPNIESKGVIDEAFWKSASAKGGDQQMELAVFLAELSCSNSGPDVARSLLRSGRILATGAHIATFSETLRNRRSDPSSCPGVVGFTEQDWAALAILVSNARKSAAGVK